MYVDIFKIDFKNTQFNFLKQLYESQRKNLSMSAQGQWTVHLLK